MSKRISRRDYLQGSLAGAGLLGLHSMMPNAASGVGPNSEIRLAIIGLGGLDVIGGVGGRGRQLIDALDGVPGAKITAICDVDETVLAHQVERFRKSQVEVKAFRDLRHVFDDQEIDAVVIALPNHWHALATILACQAGKDVYVEKPFSHDLWEGRQMVAAARKYGRMVQVGMQRRSSTGAAKDLEALRAGEVGPIRCAHAIVYRGRDGIARAKTPLSIPPTVDFDLWCGPVAKTPLMRTQLHYEWHWFWDTGNGEIGNNGIHNIDVARWALDQNGPPPRVMSIGGRWGVDDDAETPNTQIAIMDYDPAPLICEIRNLRKGRGDQAIGQFRGVTRGLVLDCEGGYCVEAPAGMEVYDKQGKMIKKYPLVDAGQRTVSQHFANFFEAMRTRDASSLAAEAKEGHDSAACFHLANISHRLGQARSAEEIAASIKALPELSDSFERCRQYLRENGVDLDANGATLGPWISYDASQERFTGEFSEQATRLSRKEYRKPFEVPELVG